VEILKQHYEKIVLGALLLAFVFALVYLLDMVESARMVTANDLQYEAPATKYEQKDFKDSKFAVDTVLGKMAHWDERTDKGKLGFTAELTVPMKSLRCEHKECKKIMPWSVAKTKKCPFCENTIADPGEPKDYESEIAKLDTDQDGMPDRYELKMGFNPQDANDAEQDKDGDGFSNLYEFLVKTDPTNPGSLPSLEKCIYLVRLQKKTMPLRLNGVTVVDKNDKKSWEIAMTINNMRDSKKIGEEIEVQKKKYRILDAEYKTRDSQEASVVLDNDASRVTIAPLKEGKIDEKGKLVLEVGKKVHAPDHIALIRDVRNPNSRGFRKAVGETFTIKRDDAGKKDKGVTFQVISTDAVKEAVRLLNTETSEEFLLEKKARIPKNAYVKKDGSNMSEAEPAVREDNKSRRRRRARN